MKYIAPFINGNAFTCPHCHTLSQMRCEHFGFREDFDFNAHTIKASGRISVCRCINCGGKIIWMADKYIYPDIVPVEPVQEMPDEVKDLYLEAGSILQKSPRAACALLRLAVDRLCIVLGADEGTIDKNIAKLVKEGLPIRIQQALDITRVVGNKAVHPGTIAFDVDDVATATMLFNLINMIVEKLILEPKKLQELYDALPSSTRDAIIKRDM